MSFTTPIDLYCERMGHGLFAEPINAISNLAFVLAAVVAWRAIAQRGGRDPLETAVVLMAACIGIGSGLFHTFANGWSLMADVVPIWTFVVMYVLAVIYRSTGERRRLSGPMVAAGVLLVAAVIALLTAPDEHVVSAVAAPLNGSLYYLPAVVALLVVVAVTTRRRHPARGYFQWAAAVFFVSLTLRTIDHAVCDVLPIGTHFGWHLGDGLMVGILLLALVRHYPPQRHLPGMST